MTAIKESYNSTIEFLFSKLPMFSRIGAAAYKKDLTNIRKLCELLDNPHQKFQSIHVAGTNGKGSVSHMLAAVLQTAGYKTGLYTSPHLKDFRERIKVNGEMISEEFVVDFTERIKSAIDEIEPSFFEITVAMAFEYFAEQKIDVAVIETGLGGRFDSTNIIFPILSVITNIGWDHMNLLGDSLGKIAFEKAGIIKENVPVIIGETINETKNVFQTIAAERKSPLIIAEEKRQSISWHWEKHKLVVEAARKDRENHQVYHLDLPGIYQTKNLLTVLEICSQLQQLGWNVEEKNIKEALTKTKELTGLHGRWDVIAEHPTIVLDVAHNEDGIKQVLEQVELIDPEHLHIVFGAVKDKEVGKVLSLLPKLARYYFTQAHIPRALSMVELKQAAEKLQLEGEVYEDVNAAIKAAKGNAEKGDLILVCGSIFLVGEVDY